MNEGTTGMVVLGAIIAVCSILAHALQKRFWVAVAVATFASAALFQVAAFIHLGHLDPFFIIAVFISLGISAFSAIIIGLIFRLNRSKDFGRTETGTPFFLRKGRGSDNNST